MTSPTEQAPHADLVAIVTGGNSGIGLATANRLLEGGASVLVVDLAAEPVIEHSNLRFLTIDVAADEAATRIAEAAIGYWGHIDFLVNNAGMVGGGPVENMQLRDWDRILSVNVSAVFRLCQACIPHLKQSPRGRIVNLSLIHI